MALYLYTQPFSAVQDSPFWEALKAVASRPSQDVLVITATRAMQRNLKNQMAAWRLTTGVLPLVCTLDDLVFENQSGVSVAAATMVYLVESLLTDPIYETLWAASTIQVAAQTLFQTFLELQRHMIAPDQLLSAYREAAKKAGPDGQVLHKQGDLIVNLFRRFLSESRQWPFLSVYQAYHNVLPSLSGRLQGKSVFVVGFWELPPYQRPLLQAMVREAEMVAIHLHYSSLSPVYEAAQPFYTWLRGHFSDLREIPFHGKVVRSPIRVFSCDTAEEEVRFARQFPAHDTGVLVPEAEPYAELFRQQAVGSEHWPNEVGMGCGDSPVFSFLMAILDPELPSPSAMARLLSHVLVSQAVSGWHWPKIQGEVLGVMRGWGWEDWVSVLHQKGGLGHAVITALLRLVEKIQGARDAQGVMDGCLESLACLGLSLSEWPGSVMTAFFQTITVVSHLKQVSRFRGVLASLAGTSDTWPSGWPCYGKFESYMVWKSDWVLLGCRDGVWPKVMRRAYALPAPVVKVLGLPMAGHYVQADTYVFHAVLHQAQRQVTVLYPVTHEDVPQALTLFLSGFESLPLPKPDMPVDVEARPVSGTRTVSAWESRPPHINMDSFSPTRLETYQGCPYKYYLRHILGLVETDDPLDIGAGVMGELIHDVFRRLMAMRRQEGLLAEEPQSRRAVSEAIAALQSRYGTGTVKAWLIGAKAPLLLGTETMPGLIPETLAAMTALALPIFSIAEEVPFSETPTRSGIALTVLDVDLVLTGRIDAIYAIGGTDMILVVDYKTGSKSYVKKDLETYKNIQLPLYMAMARRLYPDREVVGAAIVYVRHKDPGIEMMALSAEGKAALDMKRKRPVAIDGVYHEETLAHVAGLVRGIRRGEFGVMGVPDAEPFLPKRKELCATCTYRWLCDFPQRWEGYRDGG